jgi:pimeloyl-ACP methyl ester carboxylesterase
MAVMKTGDVEIYYEEHGHGIPVLCFAPGSLRSHIDYWHCSPKRPTEPPTFLDPTVDLAGDFHVIAMDQRNAGRSRTAIEADHGWHTYAADHLALMDHLGFRQFHTLGGCIGGSFCLKLCEIAPDRITAAVLQNPIGLHPDHPEYFPESFAEWAAEMKAERPHLDDAKIAAFGKTMWDGEFVYSVSRDFCRCCSVPTFLLPGTDKPHPAVTSDELKQLLPGLEVLENWRGPEHLDEQLRRVLAFLDRHTPKQARKAA